MLVRFDICEVASAELDMSVGGASGISRGSVASDVWGNAQFKGCKFCRRPRSHPNPFEGITGKAFLQFRSERHQECLPCNGTMRKSHPDMVTADDKAKFAKRLSEDQDEYAAHMKHVSSYESLQLESMAKRRKQGRTVDDKDVAQPLREEAVSLSSEVGLEMRRCLGILWPTDIYQQKFGKKPPHLTRIDQDGQIITGVLLPRSEGMADGCTEIFDIKKATARKSMEAATSSNAIADLEVEKTWKKAKASHSFDTTVTDVDGASQMQLTQSLKKAPGDDFDDLLDFGPDVGGTLFGDSGFRLGGL